MYIFTKYLTFSKKITDLKMKNTIKSQKNFVAY